MAFAVFGVKCVVYPVVSWAICKAVGRRDCVMGYTGAFLANCIPLGVAMAVRFSLTDTSGLLKDGSGVYYIYISQAVVTLVMVRFMSKMSFLKSLIATVLFLAFNVGVGQLILQWLGTGVA